MDVTSAYTDEPNVVSKQQSSPVLPTATQIVKATFTTSEEGGKTKMKTLLVLDNSEIIPANKNTIIYMDKWLNTCTSYITVVKESIDWALRENVDKKRFEEHLFNDLKGKYVNLEEIDDHQKVGFHRDEGYEIEFEIPKRGGRSSRKKYKKSSKRKRGRSMKRTVSSESRKYSRRK